MKQGIPPSSCQLPEVCLTSQPKESNAVFPNSGLYTEEKANYGSLNMAVASTYRLSTCQITQAFMLMTRSKQEALKVCSNISLGFAQSHS